MLKNEWVALDVVSAPHIHRPHFVAPGCWPPASRVLHFTAMKKRLTAATVTAAILALSLAGTVLAQDDGHGAPDPMVQSGGNAVDFLPVVLWSLAGAAIFAVILGVLYLLKRQVGGFPEHPDWVAPISIMRSRDLPGDDDAGHGDAHGHGGHAPAH